MGITLGLTAGFSPGPLSALVISETFSHNTKAGIKASLAPFITDAPIVLGSYLLLQKLSYLSWLLGALSVFGAVYLFYLGISGFKTDQELSIQKQPPKSIFKAVIVNFASPHHYIFWIMIGSPILVKALHVSNIAFIAFLAGFYCCLIGSKIFMAIVVGRSKKFFSPKTFFNIQKLLGIVLMIFAVILIIDGIKITIHGI